MPRKTDHVPPCTGVILAGLLVWAAITACAGRAQGEPAGDTGTLPLVSLLPRDAIEAVDLPAVFPAGSGSVEYAPDERVLGVVVNGAARAYSLSWLSSHWVVNDELGGEAILVTWSPLSYTGAVFSRQVSGGPLLFGESGKLLHNNLVMYDEATGSLWSQFLGQAITGAHHGETLEPLPVTLIAWGGWLALHPDSEAVQKGYFGDFDPYSGYYESDVPGAVRPERVDPRLPAKSLVLGASPAGERIAFPIDLLTANPLINLEIAGAPIVVAYSERWSAGAIFYRELAGRLLTFQATDSPHVVVDEETGSFWNIISGISIGGPLAGEQLDRVPFTHSFWYHWVEWIPETLLYGEGGT